MNQEGFTRAGVPEVFRVVLLAALVVIFAAVAAVVLPF